MASNAKKTEAIRRIKRRPNKANQKADMKRIQRNREILRELTEKETS